MKGELAILLWLYVSVLLSITVAEECSDFYTYQPSVYELTGNLRFS